MHGSTWGSVLLALTLTQSSLDAQIITIGADNSLLQQGVQYWTTVSSLPEAYQRIGEFVITTPCVSTVMLGTICAPAVHREGTSSIDDILDLGDGDWNIEVAPLAGWEDLLVNAEGRSNTCCGNLMELEINAYEFPLQLYFQAGDFITALGWHVEDWGHSAVSSAPNSAGLPRYANSTNGGKTEFHPIIYLQKGGLGDSHFMLFTAQDGSGRFPLADDNLQNYFAIPLQPSPAPVAVFQAGLPGTRLVASTVALLREDQQVDIRHQGFTQAGLTPLTDAQRNTCWQQQQSQIMAFQGIGTVSVVPKLKGFSSPSPDLFCLHPLYFGEFSRLAEPLLSENIVANVVPVGNGYKAIDADITATLAKASTLDPFVYSDWWYSDVNGSQNLTNPPGNSVTFHLRYSPSQGLTNASWSLYVIAQTEQPGAPTVAAPQLGVGPVHTRGFAQSFVSNFITPSSLTFDVTPSTQTVTGWLGVPVPCTLQYDAHPTAFETIPSQGGPQITLQVALEQDHAGVHIQTPVLQNILNDGTVLSLDGATVQWVGGAVKVAFQKGTASIVGLYGAFSTVLGEHVIGHVSLEVQGCDLGVRQILPSQWRPLQKAVLAISRLKQLGLWSGDIPSAWPAELLRTWGNPPSGVSPSPELPKEANRLLDTYYLLIEGKSVSKQEEARLARAITAAAKLPDLPLPAAHAVRPSGITTLHTPGTPLPTSIPEAFSREPSFLRGDSTYVVTGFTFNDYDVPERATVATLLWWASALRASPATRLLITYSAEPDASTQAHADRRVNGIRQLLIDHGVEPNRLTVKTVSLKGVGAAGRVQINRQ